MYQDYELMREHVLSTPAKRANKQGLRPIDKNVYTALVDRCYTTGNCQYPYHTIAKWTGISSSDVGEALESLLAFGALAGDKETINNKTRWFHLRLVTDAEAGLKPSTEPKAELQPLVPMQPHVESMEIRPPGCNHPFRLTITLEQLPG